MFFWNSLAFLMIQRMLAIWSLLPLPFLKPAWTPKFTVHVLLKPGLEKFEHYFTSMWDECNCAVVWTFFGFAFLWDWNENWPFPVLWPLLSVLLVYKIAQGQMWNSVMLKLFQNISLVLGHICMFKLSDTAELSVCNHFLLCQQTSSLPYHAPQ